MISSSLNAGESSNGSKPKSCHQCRHIKPGSVRCMNQLAEKRCSYTYCATCLVYRYGEKAGDAIASSEKWTCPRCRDICNCCNCIRRKGAEPIRNLNTKRKAPGFSRVSDKPIEIIPDNAPDKELACVVGIDMASDQLGNVSGSQNAESSNGKTKSCHQCRHIKPVSVRCMNQTEERKCSYVYCATCLIRYGEKADEIASSKKWSCPKCREICNCCNCMRRKGVEPIRNLNSKRKAPGFSRASDTPIEIIPDNAIIAPDKELTSVVGINMASEQVGYALQFLEFCACFGEILDIKKGEPENVLQDLLVDQTESQGKLCAAAQFHFHLLRIIQEERGEKCARRLSKGKSKSPWFDMLKKFLSRSQCVLKALGFDCLDDKADYDTLDSSEKLILLNILCDEVLQTTKIRNWLSGESRIVARKDEDTSLKQPREHDTDNAVFPRYWSTDTLRTYPVYKQKGFVFWKLDASGGDILCQNVGKGDVLTRDVKWYSVNEAVKEAIEKHISLSRKQNEG